MKIEFERDVVPATDENIRAFEAKWEITLPDSYKEFLKLYNGGSPTPGAFKFTEDAIENEGEVRQFLGLNSNGEDNLEEYLESYGGCIPAGALPIAYDDFGNLICLNFAEPAVSVGFWDHETEDEDATAEPKLFFVANDFSSFCESFYE